MFWTSYRLSRPEIKMTKSITLTQRTFAFLLGGSLLSVILAFNFAHQVAAKDTVEEGYSSLRNFTDVLALVQKNYVDEVGVDKLVNGAIKGMLQTLDPHSSYLAPEMYKDLQVETKGRFGGLGIEITVKDNLLTVVAPIEDSPAARAGVQAGDQIIKIEDEFTKDLTLVEAVKKMRGPRGTPITISVHREGSAGLIPIKVIRDVIKVKSVRYRQLDDGFVYVRVAQFQEGTAQEVLKGLNKMQKELESQKIAGLVLDLRNNPGGLLTQAIEVSDIFLEGGIIVYTDGRLQSQKQKYYGHDDGNEPEYPIVVLVNGGSASASEIVSGALKDHKRGVVLGTQTFGKGSVQTILPMENSGALRLTTALYYTKSGNSIQAKGVTPDIVVPAGRFPKDSEELLEEDEPSITKEKDLKGAIKNPTGKKKIQEKDEKDKLRAGSREAMKADLSLLLEDDTQLEEALKLLKSWNIFNRDVPADNSGDVVASDHSKTSEK